MDLKTLSRRKIQALCKKNKLPANITNVAMANALNSLQFIEGIEEILNQSESEIAQSPMVPPTGGRSRTVKAVGVSTPATRRRAAAASTSAPNKIKVPSKDSLDEIEEVKNNVSVKTPAPASRIKGVRETTSVKHLYSPRRSARLANKIQEPKEISEGIMISSFTQVIDENSEITVLDNFKKSEVKRNESKDISEGTSEIPNGDVAVASIGQAVFSEIKTDTDQKENEQVHGLVSEEVCVMETEDSIKDTKMNPNMDEETEASIEKVAILDSNVNEASPEDGEIKSNVDETTKAVSIEEDTYINTKDDEENDIAEIKADSCNMVNEQEAYADEIENDDYMVDDFAVNIQKTNDLELPGENESSNDEEFDMSEADFQEEKNISNVEIQESNESIFDDDVSVIEFNQEGMNHPENILAPEVEIQDEHLNNEAKHEFIQEEKDVSEYTNPIHIAAPLINDDLAFSITQKTVGRFQISDDKENLGSDRKPALMEEPWRELSIRLLKTLFKEKLKNPEQLKEEDDIKDKSTRPALKTLPENKMLVESQD